MAVPGLEESHFGHWLSLFYQILRELERDPAESELVGARAHPIAESLLTGIANGRGALTGIRAGASLPAN